MNPSLTAAAIQMDAAPAPTAERLQRAAALVADAAAAGADLIVLPEVFNTGYVYDDANYERAEGRDGRSLTWLKETAAKHAVHLAGSLLLRDGGEIYNSLFLFAPNGRCWRYDKRYPWGWERAYFRPGRGVTAADTALGRIGLLICWDSAHPDLWRQYAGRVDLIVIASSPPLMSDPTYHFPGGATLTFDAMGPFFRRLKGADRAVFGDMIDEQTAWLGVPAVNTVGCGRFRSRLPNARGSVLAMATLAPRLLRHLPRAEEAVLTCGMTPGCKVVGGNGRVLAQRRQEEGEGFVLAPLTLPAERPRPTTPQPPRRAPWLSYLISDRILPALTAPQYRRRRKRKK